MADLDKESNVPLLEVSVSGADVVAVHTNTPLHVWFLTHAHTHTHIYMYTKVTAQHMQQLHTTNGILWWQLTLYGHRRPYEQCCHARIVTIVTRTCSPVNVTLILSE